MIKPYKRALLALLFATLLSNTCFAATASKLSSFDGLEYPKEEWDNQKNKWITLSNSTARSHIEDKGSGEFRFHLHYNSKKWDGDRDKKKKDRQRSEVKGLGSHQKDGEAFEYKMRWRSKSGFKDSSSFCHIFQLKSMDGDKDHPAVTLTLKNDIIKCIYSTIDGDDDYQVGGTEPHTTNSFTDYRIKVKTYNKSNGAKGYVKWKGSNGGNAISEQSKSNIKVGRKDANTYRPKWGFYRKVTSGLRDDYISQKNIKANKI